MKKKRRLRKWVRTTLNIMATIAMSIALLIGLMWTMTEAHYQRIEYWNEVGGY